VRVVEPVDFVYILVSLCSKTNGFDVKIGKTLVGGVADQFLGFNGQVFGVKPHAEHLSIKG
jgi:hypothetical protein